MKKIRALTIAILLFLFGSVNASQQLETIVYPSEDEITEALRMGEISFEQYFILLEIIINGVDEHSLYLLDEIPLTFSFSHEKQLKADESITPFIESKKNRNTNLLIKHHFASYIEDSSSSKYQTTFQYSNKSIDSELKIRREYSGNERIIRRFIKFRDVSNYLKQLTIGNYSKRFGLGALFGYRGKMVSFSNRIDDESFMFPDYGGFNGFYSKWVLPQLIIETLFSYNRDDENSISSTGVSFLKERTNSKTAIIIGINNIKNRINNKSIVDFKTSLFSKLNFQGGYLSNEIAYNRYKKTNAIAYISEGVSSSSTIRINYSFWLYSDNYFDLSSGSKTSIISERIDSLEINYDFSSKRSGQIGMVIKSRFQLSEKANAAFSLLRASKNIDSTETQLFGQLAYKFTKQFSLSFDILNRMKIRRGINNNNLTKTKYRLQMKYRLKNFSNRSYLSFNNYYEYGLFSEFRYKTESYGNLHFWFNLSEFNIHRSQFGYLYLFIKNEKNISDYLKLGFKISHRYDRYVSNKYENQFSIDMSYRL